MIEIEKTGKPAIPIVSGRFEEDAIASSRAFAMPDLQFVIVPRIYRNLAIDLCISQTEAALDDIVEVLTIDQEHSRKERDSTTATERFEGEDRWDAIMKMNEQWLLRDWGDSLVLYPPTPEAVDELVAGAGLDRDELVCDMPPGFGLATVGKIAINAAMAGTKPEHMPVVNRGCEGAVAGGVARRKVAADVHQSARADAGRERPDRKGVGDQSAVGAGAGTRQPCEYHDRARVLALPAESRVLVSGADGHGHHRHDP